MTSPSGTKNDAPKSNTLENQNKVYYGWVLLPIGFLIYGFGLAPVYYSWGFYGPEMIKEIDISLTHVGSIFGVFQFFYTSCSPIVAVVIGYVGLRWTMAGGALMSAIAAFYMANAETLFDCYIAFGVLAGLGVGFTSQLPSQTLATYWFKKYRARAMAAIMCSGGLVGALVPLWGYYVLEHSTWREGWYLVSIMAFIVAIVAIIFVRNKPEDLGQAIDGIYNNGEQESSEKESQNNSIESEKIDSQVTPNPKKIENDEPQWSVKKAILTPQFLLITLAAIAYNAPWGTYAALGRFQLESLGLTTAAIAGVLAAKSGISTLGRLTAALGDFVAPLRLLSIALFVEALGVTLLIFADTAVLAYASVILLGLGFGTAYLTVPIVFGSFFGRNAFAGTQGVSRFITGIVKYIIPTLTGFIIDTTGSYSIAFGMIALITFSGAIGATFCPIPNKREPNSTP